jgi:hypothetical protein
MLLGLNIKPAAQLFISNRYGLRYHTKQRYLGRLPKRPTPLKMCWLR